jgi:transcriptional regulator with PAS, ATPase and Fis domain
MDRTLRAHSGNRTRAAKELGISRATLINKIKRYHLTA